MFFCGRGLDSTVTSLAVVATASVGVSWWRELSSFEAVEAHCQPGGVQKKRVDEGKYGIIIEREERASSTWSVKDNKKDKVARTTNPNISTETLRGYKG